MLPRLQIYIQFRRRSKYFSHFIILYKFKVVCFPFALTSHPLYKMGLQINIHVCVYIFMVI